MNSSAGWISAPFKRAERATGGGKSPPDDRVSVPFGFENPVKRIGSGIDGANIQTFSFQPFTRRGGQFATVIRIAIQIPRRNVHRPGGIIAGFEYGINAALWMHETGYLSLLNRRDND